mmetsp:Transcript_7102/g.12885  ORF Transcript_7102/g.12885 Transcript_7102/m.12885 type:complete len:251 (-) Transcript_7102:108-860(-)
MARLYWILVAVYAIGSLAIRDVLEDLTEETGHGALQEGDRTARRMLRRRDGTDNATEKNEDEEEEEANADDNDDDSRDEDSLRDAGRKHSEAKYVYKPATEGFNELDKVVESIDAAADDASAKAKTVDKDYAAYQGRMAATGRILDTLSLSGEQFKKEVVDYFARAEEDKFSPLAQRVKHKEAQQPQTTSQPTQEPVVKHVSQEAAGEDDSEDDEDEDEDEDDGDDDENQKEDEAKEETSKETPAAGAKS